MSGWSSYFDITGTMWIVSLFVMIGLKGMWVQWIWCFIIPVFYGLHGQMDPAQHVMTGSEWMVTRFGTGKAGDTARLVYTLYAVLTITAFLAYGRGHGEVRLGLPAVQRSTCAALIIGITGIYVVMGGFDGVVLVEIFQTTLLSVGALAIAW